MRNFYLCAARLILLEMRYDFSDELRKSVEVNSEESFKTGGDKRILLSDYQKIDECIIMAGRGKKTSGVSAKLPFCHYNASTSNNSA